MVNVEIWFQVVSTLWKDFINQDKRFIYLFTNIYTGYAKSKMSK